MYFMLIPAVRAALLPYAAIQPMIYGLAAIVNTCITNRGDARIPSAGFYINQGNIGLLIKATSPGTNSDLSYRTVAAVIRGIWDMSAAFGYGTFSAHLYTGSITSATLRGQISLIASFSSENGTSLMAVSSSLSAADITQL